jgi:putative hydrolase of the HAD superfamily
MKRSLPITTIFLDIGGVLLTDGWDHHARRRAAESFKLKWGEMEERHHLMFDAYEAGKVTLEEYLKLVVFYRERPFTRAQFRRFMFAQSKPYPKMIELIARLKVQHALKVVVVSNEARELNAYRIREFRLQQCVDFFVSSCFVHIRKPDADIFRLALDMSQVRARQVLYIDNTPLFIRIAEGLRIQSLLHVGYGSTRTKLASFGLHDEQGPRRRTALRGASRLSAGAPSSMASIHQGT